MLNNETLSNYDKELLEEVLPVYVNDSTEAIKAIETAFTDKDQKTLRFYAHKLKGSSAMIGADKLSKLSGGIEQLIDNEQPVEAGSITDLVQEHQVLLEYLKKPGIFDHIEES